MVRGYTRIAQFQCLTEKGECCVTRMKRNLKFEILESFTYVNPQGLVTLIAPRVRFALRELPHEVRCVEIFYGSALRRSRLETLRRLLELSGCLIEKPASEGSIRLKRSALHEGG